MSKHHRFRRIDAAYMAALGDRDPDGVDIVDLLPAIFDAVPDTSVHEIVAALGWPADQALQEAKQLERYSRAKAGQRANAGKRAQPGDGTLPFKRKVVP